MQYFSEPLDDHVPLNFLPEAVIHSSVVIGQSNLFYYLTKSLCIFNSISIQVSNCHYSDVMYYCPNVLLLKMQADA